MAHLDLLVGEVEAQPNVGAAIVERAADHDRAAIFVVDRHVAAAQRAVQAQADGAAAKAARHVERAAEMLVGGVVGGGTREVALAGALGDEVDAATDARPARQRAVQEGVGTIQHLHLLVELGRDQLARGDAVEPVKGDVVRIKGETADHELLGGIAEAVGGADRGVILQHLAERLRLLVEDQCGIVALDAERHVARRLVTEDADLAAADDLRLVGLLRGDDDRVSGSLVGLLRRLREGGRSRERDGQRQCRGGAAEQLRSHVVIPLAMAACMAPSVW